MISDNTPSCKDIYGQSMSKLKHFYVFREILNNCPDLN